MKNFPWIDKKISSIDLNNLSHALIVEGQEGVGKNQICQYLINCLLNEKNSQNLIRNNSHPDLFCINNETLISYFQREDKDRLKNKTNKIKQILTPFLRTKVDQRVWDILKYLKKTKSGKIMKILKECNASDSSSTYIYSKIIKEEKNVCTSRSSPWSLFV